MRTRRAATATGVWVGVWLVLTPATGAGQDFSDPLAIDPMLIMSTAENVGGIAPELVSCGGPYEYACSQTVCTWQVCQWIPFVGNQCSCLSTSTTYWCNNDRLNIDWSFTALGYVCAPCGGVGQDPCDNGARCNAGAVEFLGSCRACGGAGELACSGGACGPGTVNVVGFCVDCGDAGEPACAGDVCNAGAVNVAGTCLACGGSLQLACAGGVCNTGYVNVTGVCTQCGAPGEPVCADGSCDEGAMPGPGGLLCILCGQTNEPACPGAVCPSDLTMDVTGLCRPCGHEDEFACLGGLASPYCLDPGLTPVGIGPAAICRPCGHEGDVACPSDPRCEAGTTPVHVGTGLGSEVCRPCGGAWELVCDAAPACEAWTTPVLGVCTPCGSAWGLVCDAEPACEPWLNPTVVCTPCGGELEPVCLSGPECQTGYRTHPDFPFACLAIPATPEPECNCTAVPDVTAPGEPIWGYADLHAHQFGNLGFGGLAFWGAPFDPNGISYALPACGFTQEFAGVSAQGEPLTHIPGYGIPVHGPLHALDAFGLAAASSALPADLSHLGDPEFGGWPRWNSVDHQRMYYRWLERAFRSGLKLIVMQAVNNEISCRVGSQRADFGPDASARCNDMLSVDRQIEAAKALEREIDRLSGGPGRGWYRIAYSAAEARQIINSGKMAVVLGVEVDALFDCQGGRCSQADVDAWLQRYYDMGVRHLYPIHLFDNDFGGTAFYDPAFYLANRIATGHFFDSYDCADDGFAFKLTETNPLVSLFAWFFGFPEVFDLTTNVADCNALGLTPLGEHLIRGMIDKKMIIDIDHMSAAGVNRTIEIAEGERYPVVATHIWFNEQQGGTLGERAKTRRQVERIRDLGGLVAPILLPNNNAATEAFQRDGAAVVANDCGFSSKEWAQRYLQAVDQMQGGPYLVGVGFGSDFGGMTMSLGPRFGAEGCAGGGAPASQGGAVDYPFEAHGKPGLFFQATTGARVFDVNVDGVAHVGLMPDFIQDLKSVGLTHADLVPFFRSAEAFVQMWERIDRRGTMPPTTTATLAPPPNAAGWNNSPVEVALQARAPPGSGAVAAIGYRATGAQTIEPASAPGPSARVAFVTEGASELVFHATDDKGNVEPEQRLSIRIDQAPPDVQVIVSPDANEAGWHRTPVTVELAGDDELSGLEHCDGPFVMRGEGANQSVEGTCADRAGNVSTATVTGISIDMTPPGVTSPESLRLISPPDGLAVTSPALAALLAAAVAEDALDLSPQITHDAPERFPLGTTVVTFTAIDRAGNTATATTRVTLKAIPTIIWPAPADIVYGTPLGQAQLGATASVPGEFAYDPPAGTVLPAGTAHVVRTTFTPADASRYEVAMAEVRLAVLYSTGACLGEAGHAVLPPIAADGTSVFRANRTVPVKFRVCDANGQSIGTPDVVASFGLVRIAPPAGETVVDLPVESTGTSDTFRWDPTARQWIMNLATAGLSANAAYEYQITLNDGSAIEVRFTLR